MGAGRDGTVGVKFDTAPLIGGGANAPSAPDPPSEPVRQMTSQRTRRAARPAARSARTICLTIKNPELRAGGTKSQPEDSADSSDQAANRMWGGRFAGGPAAIMERINASIDF